jgi:hypothetical protein
VRHFSMMVDRNSLGSMESKRENHISPSSTVEFTASSFLPDIMILSTFQSFLPYRRHCMVLFLSSTLIFHILAQRLTTEIVPGSVMPDTAFAGYSPEQSRDWYLRLRQDEHQIVLLLGILDLLGIIPSYVLGGGAQLVHTGCPRLLCYLPIWTASFDLIESMTTFCTVAALHSGTTWVPSSFHLLLASTATQFKGVFLAISILLMSWQSIRSKREKTKVP